MMLLINGLQPIERHMRVHLRGRNISMAKNRLHRTQIGAFSTMCVAQLWRNMCGLAWRPMPYDAA